jgi:hypothetical protein
MKLEIFRGHLGAAGDEGAFLAVFVILAVQAAVAIAPLIQRALERRRSWKR